MAYGKKYTITSIGYGGQTFVGEIYERDYSGTVYPFELDKFPFTYRILASSDDVYQPILASEVLIKVDITDFNNALPDFLSFDDTKYFVKILVNSNLFWRGYMLSDNIQIPFNTGFIGLEMSCTDGFAILKDSTYTASTLYYTNETVDRIIRNCIDKLGYDGAWYINYAVNIFTDTMSTTTPFTQTYINPVVFVGKTYYEVLEGILTSFGANLYQADGEWWVCAANEKYTNTIRSVRIPGNATDAEALAITATTTTLRDNIAPHPAAVHFLDGSQRKIIRKGYSIVDVNEKWEHANNYLWNADFLRLPDSGEISSGWSNINTGSGTCSIITENNVKKAFLKYNSIPGSAKLLYYKQHVIGYKGNSIEIKFDLEVIGTATLRAMNLLVELIDITNATNKNYLVLYNGAAKWSIGSGGYASQLYEVKEANTVSITTDPLPFTGFVKITFSVENDGSSSYRTHSWSKISNISLSFKHPLNKLSLTAQLNSNSKYKKSIDLIHTSNVSDVLNSGNFKWVDATYEEIGTGGGITQTYWLLEITGQNVDVNGYYSHPSVTVGNVSTLPTTVLFSSLTLITNNILFIGSTLQLQSWFYVKTAYPTAIDTTVTALPTSEPIADPSTKTALLASNGLISKNWGELSGSKTFSHKQVMLQRFTQIYFGSQINIEGNIYSMLSPKKSITLTDGTSKYSVTGKAYILGNTEINMIANETSATLLEVSQVEKISTSQFVQSIEYDNKGQ